jgi:hypothetical protein
MLTKNLRTTILGFIGALLIYAHAKGLVDQDLLVLLDSTSVILFGISTKDADLRD